MDASFPKRYPENSGAQAADRKYPTAFLKNTASLNGPKKLMHSEIAIACNGWVGANDTATRDLELLTYACNK